ncbi:MAG: hypothetical protein J6X16_08355 [Bacteroidales bacterium]|nr:hypothetical protein [Bacteroidales bacterium]
MKKNVCLHYLPCSEDYKKQQCNSNASVHFATPFPTVNCQLSTVNWIHTFSAKEKDTETGLSYFGARYYSSDLSIWLSVDPMSDKYPHQSNYVYCSNNPIRITDPNGEDEWEVDKKGNITWKCESEKHQLFAIDKKGKRTGEFITLKNKNILNQLTKGKKNVLKGFDGNVCEEGNRREAVVGKKDVDDLLKVFKFVADNSDVEWEFEYSKEDGRSQYSLVTDGFSGQVTSHFGSKAITSIHSHPKEPNNYQSEVNSLYGDRGYSNSYPRTNMYVYMPKSTRLFSVNKNAYIRHINNDYRRFINLGR